MHHVSLLTLPYEHLPGHKAVRIISTVCSGFSYYVMKSLPIRPCPCPESSPELFQMACGSAAFPIHSFNNHVALHDVFGIKIKQIKGLEDIQNIIHPDPHQLGGFRETPVLTKNAHDAI